LMGYRHNIPCGRTRAEELFAGLGRKNSLIVDRRWTTDDGPWTMDHGRWTMDYWFPGILVQMSTVPHSVLPKTRLYSGGTPVVPGYSSMPSTSPGGMSSMLYPVTWMPSTKYWGGQFGLPLRAK